MQIYPGPPCRTKFGITLTVETTLKDIASAISLHKKEEKYEINTSPRLVVITDGPNSVILAQDHKVIEYPVPKIPQENFIDTNGAGDAFAAGFIYGLVYDKSIEECVKLGCKMAEIIIGRSGCTFPDRSGYDFLK